MSLIERLCVDLCQTNTWLHQVAMRAPFAYKRFTIAKKNGGRRMIDQPARETKLVQYWLIDNVFNDLPVSEHATAYRKGKSIKDNANVHVRAKFICKFDFKNFFPSITEEDVIRHLRKFKSNLSIEEVAMAARLIVKKENANSVGRLTIGSPASPIMSNSILFDFDEEFFNGLRSLNICYSRYADDITLSSNEPIDVKSMRERIVSTLLSTKSPAGLEINDEKTVVVSKARRRVVTGLILTNEGVISIGRERKRLISAMIHRYMNKTLPVEENARLQGLLSFACSIESNFMRRMIKKYGEKVINEIVRMKY